MKFRWLPLLLLALPGAVLSQGLFSRESDEKKESVVGAVTTRPPGHTREMVLGNILKGALENMHLANKSVDDKLSREAFKLYLERIDYGKQMLTEGDVRTLRAFEDKMDDALVSGQLTILDTTQGLFDKRIPQIEGWVKEWLAKPFNYNQKETLETDPDKRKFSKDEKELRALWGRMLKYDVMGRLADLKEERDQDPAAKAAEAAKATSKKKKKRSNADGEDLKKMDDAALEAKARTKTGESWKKILDRIKAEKRDDKLDKFYNALARVYDPHTNYLIPEEREDFDIDMTGKLEGIGAILREEGPYIKVEHIVPGSASWKTKELESDDTILKVAQGGDEPVDVVDMPLRDAVKLIRGKKGSEVRLTVKKPNGIIKQIAIVRDVVETEDTYARGTLLELDGSKVGYIHLPKFYRDFNDRSGRNCTDDIRKELVKLKKLGAQGVVLDLRNNGGGALEDARMISGLFIEKGPIVQVKASTGSVEVLADTDPSIEFEKPVLVLINRFSASASEIVAAALQDYQRALVVGGEFSHGKGTVQLVVDLDNYVAPMARSYSPLGALKITIQKFYRVNGASTQFKGVTPDVVLPDPYAHLESGEQFLKHSIPWGKVPAVAYKKWKPAYDRKKVVAASQARVKTNARFKKIAENIAWYDKNRKLTSKSVAMDDFLKERAEIKARADALDKEEEFKALVVKPLEDPKDKAAQEKFDDFAKGLRLDPVVEESVYLVRDMIKG